jgi:hypothetical protein
MKIQCFNYQYYYDLLNIDQVHVVSGDEILVNLLVVFNVMYFMYVF